MSMAADLQGGVASVLARGAAVACLASLFGTLVFQVLIIGRMEQGRSARALLRLALGSAGLALAGLLAWLVLTARDMADAATFGEIAASLPTVLRQTVFGHLIIAQASAVVAAAACAAISSAAPGRRIGKFCAVASPGCAGLALLAQAGHSHAAAMQRGLSWLLASDILHLAAAGAWLGGLAPLLMVVRAIPAEVAVISVHRFSRLAQLCVAALAVTAAYQGWLLIGTVAAVTGTAYGWVALAKSGLFGLLLVFAAANRFVFTPALRSPSANACQARLSWSILGESAFGVAVILAAAALSQLPPPMHMRAPMNMPGMNMPRMTTPGMKM